MFQELMEKGLVKAKSYPNGLTVYKYARHVFYDALWNTDPLLLEARGMVLDADGTKVIWPFTKVFNHHENGTECEPDRLVDYVRKVNGFMCGVRFYKGELIISTTGTLDSEFADIARKHIEALPGQEYLQRLATCFTLLFEICDRSDPHIVEEEEGAWLIGCRLMICGNGTMGTEEQLDGMAQFFGAKRPHWSQAYFHEVLDELASCEHEGFMVRDARTNETIMKLKSPHYLSKKFLMRMGKGKVEGMFRNTEEFIKGIDEEFYDVVRYITTHFTSETWIPLSDQERRDIIEGYFDLTTQY